MIAQFNTPEEPHRCFRCEQTIKPPYIRRDGAGVVGNSLHYVHYIMCPECAVRELMELEDDIRNLKRR
jgi:DNA-directed RNA polymerase subunit RPC12/RpoP